MHVVDAPPLAPGCCAITSTDRGPMVDTLIDYDAAPAAGRIYISEDAVTTMGALFGMKTEMEYVRVKNRAEKLKEQLREAEQALAAERELNQALINARSDKEPVHAP